VILMLMLMLTTLSPSKHSQQAQVIRGLQGTCSDERNPEELVAREDTGDEGAQALGEGLDQVDCSHDGRPLMWEHDRGQERRPWRRVHHLRACSTDEEDQCPCEGGRDRDQGEADRRWEVREYHRLGIG